MTPLGGYPHPSRRRAQRRARSAGQETSRREPSVSRPVGDEPVKGSVFCSEVVSGENSDRALSRKKFLRHGEIPSAEIRNIRTRVRAGRGLLSRQGPRGRSLPAVPDAERGKLVCADYKIRDTRGWGYST